MVFHLHVRRQRNLRRPTIGALLMVFIAVSLLPSLMPTHPLFSTSSSSINIIEPPILLFAEAATNVAWKGNPNISPEHKAAHDAPRSQKYWDEHGIERPDYAKTDAEISAERGEKGFLFSSGGGSWLGFIFLMAGMVIMASIAYARVTGDWDTITKNPAGAFVVNCINSTMEATGNKGNRLGSSPSAGVTGNSASDAEQRRLARLARFDNPSLQTNMLDNMKEE